MANATSKAIFVPANSDRFGRSRSVFGVIPYTVKVTTTDSGGGLFVLEQNNAYLGGPPRHLHLAQEEWFYVVTGSYVVEVDGVEHPLGPGDSLLAPRGVTHTWALVGNAPGRMVVAFSPAGDMEAFFVEASETPNSAPPEQLRDLFERHGMSVIGPPLQP